MRTKQYSLVPIRAIREGTKLVSDDGFTCIPDHATRTVKRDRDRHYGEHVSEKTGRMVPLPMNSRSRLYVTCRQGRHYLDGQECSAGEHGLNHDHYVGFWIKGTEPRKGA